MKCLTCNGVGNLDSGNVGHVCAKCDGNGYLPDPETICDLNEGDLFICDVGSHTGRLYKFDRNTYRDDQETIEYSWAYEIAHLDNGEWVFATKPIIGNWNHCCVVQVVKISVG